MGEVSTAAVSRESLVCQPNVIFILQADDRGNYLLCFILHYVVTIYV